MTAGLDTKDSTKESAEESATEREEKALAERAEAILRRMTLKEKVALLSGQDAWHTVPIPRLGIPSLVMTDGPHGVRAPSEAGRTPGPATSFPTGVSMASSWNPEIIERVGAALGEETRAMGCDILLGPCVNIVRHPLAGRNFESYSEDPYLAGQIAAAYIRGVQSRCVGTSIKHFACNNQETERFRGSSQVDERTLREIYLPAFETAIKESKPWTVMCSYNRINGVYASENAHLLRDILKGEWGFRGVVISDWGANHTTVESVRGGLDIEMPGPARYYGSLLVDAVRNWQIDESVIDESVRRILRMLLISGKMDDAAGAPSHLPSGSVNTPEHQALARELAEESVTLLKNDGRILPLQKARLKSVAVLGPNAAEARIGGGGSSFLEPPYRVSPLEALQARLGDTVAVHYEKGCDNWVEPPALSAEIVTAVSPAGQPAGSGLWGQYFQGLDLAGVPALERLDTKMDFWWWGGSPDPSIDGREFAARWGGILVPKESGRHRFQFSHTGTCRLYLDGEKILESSRRFGDENFLVTGATEKELVAGQSYRLQVEYLKPAEEDAAIMRLQFAYWPRPEEDSRLERAVALARQCDAAIIFAGMPEGYETEGADRPHMDLPGRQNELIEAVARANPNTVVVLNTGSPVSMPWVSRVPAVLEAFYPGLEGGNSVARILLGEVNPSGKLSVTFPRRLEDTPAYINFPGGREVHYGEGIFVGYRYYDQRGVEPLFPFGHGLSYTEFQYGDLQAPKQAKIGDPVRLSIRVTNSGSVPGKEVVQVYVHDKESTLPRPPKELKAFAKVALQPGESKTVEFVLDFRAFAFYDPGRSRWVVEPGEFELLVGSSSRDIRARATIHLEAAE
ncbi:MAG: glycoside hydrolase family 3 C-terminal domain-containing protein [Firmicutes bacterium]|nr:glycoside hydrolase family 3 C-terminal domain-containing protein [Bacillota bacterium]